MLKKTPSDARLEMSVIAPEISVIIPVHNGDKYLAEAIQSVFDQNHTGVEVLVVDNASTDATARIACGFPSVRYFFLEKKGVVNALNHGVQHSLGTLLAFLDADDLWKPHKLAVQLDAFRRNPALDVVFGHVEQFISAELESQVKDKLSIRITELPGHVRGAMLIKKASFYQVGLFDNSLEYGEFLDWYMRAQDQELLEMMLPDVLIMRRIHGTNMGIVDRPNRNSYARLLKQGLDRRRRLAKA